MVNLHIGGAVSVFLICVSLLACDHWFNRSEPNNIQLSKTNNNFMEAPSEFVSVPSRLFFFTDERGANRSDAGWYLPESSTEQAASWTENLEPEKLAPDGNFFSSGIQSN